MIAQGQDLVKTPKHYKEVESKETKVTMASMVDTSIMERKEALERTELMVSEARVDKLLVIMTEMDQLKETILKMKTMEETLFSKRETKKEIT